MFFHGPTRPVVPGCPDNIVLKSYNKNKDLALQMRIFPLKPQNLAALLVETRWLNAVERLGPIIYSRCRCDDTDNISLRDIETSNGSIEFNDALIMIMLCIEMFQNVCGEQNSLGGQFPVMLSVTMGPNVLQRLIIFKV